AEGVWSGHSALLLIGMVAGVGLLFAVVYWLLGLFCRFAGFNHADTTAVLFCGSKKSLATGLPIAKVMFGTSPQLSLIITPIMIYHFLQLVVIGFIAGGRAAKGEVLEALAQEEAAEPSLIADDPRDKA
ncbi:bile acid:sodium symporter, partial [Xanthobacter sp. NFM-97]